MSFVSNPCLFLFIYLFIVSINSTLILIKVLTFRETNYLFWASFFAHTMSKKTWGLLPISQWNKCLGFASFTRKALGSPCLLLQLVCVAGLLLWGTPERMCESCIIFFRYWKRLALFICWLVKILARGQPRDNH